MNYLLDTHTFIWFIEGDETLSEKTKNEIIHIDNNCFLSIASLWEIAIKAGNGKLNLKIPFNRIAKFLSGINVKLLPLEFHHLIALQGLENIHKDPFDRIIVAQAIVGNYTLITKDKILSDYPVKCLW